MPTNSDIARATPGDASAIARVRTAAATHLTDTFGGGPWSMHICEAAVREALQEPRILVACCNDAVVGTLRLQSRTPCAIDIAHFTPVRRPVYVVDVAVDPAYQRQGIGRRLLEAARDAALDWPADSLRLETYDHSAGAGGFYRRCGYREVTHVTYHDVPLVYFEHLLPTHARRRARA